MFKMFKPKTDNSEMDFDDDVSMVPKIQIVPEPSLSDLLDRLDLIESKIDKLLDE